MNFNFVQEIVEKLIILKRSIWADFIWILYKELLKLFEIGPFWADWQTPFCQNGLQYKLMRFNRVKSTDRL